MSVAYRQLSSTTLLQHCCLQNGEWKNGEWSRKGGRKTANFDSALSCTSSFLPRERTCSKTIIGCSRIEPDSAPGPANVPLSTDHYANGLTKEHTCPSNETSGADASISASKLNALDISTSPERDDLDDCNTAREASNSSILPDTGENVEKGKVRRYSLAEPGFLKTIQEATLTPLEKANLEKVMKFRIENENLGGKLVVQTVRTEHMKDLENLLTDSYSELMWGPLTYRPALAWILSTYLRERQACVPNAAMLVGLYNPLEETRTSEKPSTKWWLAGVVEISFNATGKPKDMLTPLPPEDAPFMSNMAVLKKFRRRGIGRELLKGAEQLAMAMGGEELYLHCRMIDEAPLNMYKSCGYSVVETSSILSLLLFQRRRHLMYKRLGDLKV